MFWCLTLSSFDLRPNKSSGAHKYNYFSGRPPGSADAGMQCQMQSWIQCHWQGAGHLPASLWQAHQGGLHWHLRPVARHRRRLDRGSSWSVWAGVQHAVSRLCGPGSPADRPSLLCQPAASLRNQGYTWNPGIFYFFNFRGSFLPSLIRIGIQGPPLNSDPIQIRIQIRIHNSALKG